ncbi:DUF1525 domain-containing protein [Vibrio mediterranei]
MRLIIPLLILLSANIQAKTINKVVWFTTTVTNQSQELAAKESSKGAVFQLYYVDNTKKILTHFEELVPKELTDRNNRERDAYIQRHIAPKIKPYLPELMRSELGLSLAKLYRIERIPAVVINDKYVFYGLEVEDALRLFKSKDVK